MAAPDSGSLLLYGVFRSLIEHQVPLGVSDYLDAVRAIDLQVRTGDIADVANRRRLRRLCEVLWTRSPEEVRLLHRIFDRIEPPPAEEVAEARTVFESGPQDHRATPGNVREPLAGRSDLNDTGAPGAARTTEDAPRVAVSFEAAAHAGGLPLPRPVLPTSGDAAWVLQTQTVMSARALAILWRRYRRMTRVGPRTEFDLDATVASYLRRGVLHEPVLRARRTNAARLLILADASPSMAPWYPFLSTLAESLRLSRLPGGELWYYANLPRRTLFDEPSFANGRSTEKILRRFANAGLLIISDAGAARGGRHRLRSKQTRAFLDEMTRAMRAVAWVNPMPRERWSGTTAELIGDAKGVAFLPLDPASMIRAIDILRGTRAA